MKGLLLHPFRTPAYDFVLKIPLSSEVQLVQLWGP